MISQKNRTTPFGLLPFIGKTSKYTDTLLKAYLQKYNIPLTKEQFIVLAKVEEQPKQQTELAMITERDKGSLTRLVQSLEKKQYVRRRVCSHDSRVNWVEISEKGSAILERAKPVVKNAFGKLENELTEEERQLLTRTLIKIQEKVMMELEVLDAALQTN